MEFRNTKCNIFDCVMRGVPACPKRQLLFVVQPLFSVPHIWGLTITAGTAHPISTRGTLGQRRWWIPPSLHVCRICRRRSICPIGSCLRASLGPDLQLACEMQARSGNLSGCPRSPGQGKFHWKPFGDFGRWSWAWCYPQSNEHHGTPLEGRAWKNPGKRRFRSVQGCR